MNNYQDRALAEGWRLVIPQSGPPCIHPTVRVLNGTVTTDVPFNSPAEALAYVQAFANRGSEYHRLALSIVEEGAARTPEPEPLIGFDKMECDHCNGEAPAVNSCLECNRLSMFFPHEQEFVDEVEEALEDLTLPAGVAPVLKEFIEGNAAAYAAAPAMLRLLIKLVNSSTDPAGHAAALDEAMMLIGDINGNTGSYIHGR